MIVQLTEMKKSLERREVRTAGEACLNEKQSPELSCRSTRQRYECLLDQINTMEENLVMYKKGDVRMQFTGWRYRGSSSWSTRI